MVAHGFVTFLLSEFWGQLCNFCIFSKREIHFFLDFDDKVHVTGFKLKYL